MMANNIKIDIGTESGKMADHRATSKGDDVSRPSHPDLQQQDETAFWKDKYARLFADLENTKKRLARSAAREVESEKEALLQDVLPVADGLDLALMHVSGKQDNRDLLQGIEMIRNLVDKFFAKYEVTAIDALGKPFDPRLHQAIGLTRHPGYPPNTVATVEQRGYLYRDRLLRPAQVLVTPGE